MPGRKVLPPSAAGVAIVVVALSLGLLALISPYAALNAVFDAVAALVILLPPCLVGLWLVSMLRLGDLPLRWQVLLGAGLGLGSACLLILVMGLAGVLDRTIWLAILCAFAVLGVHRLRRLWREWPHATGAAATAARWSWLGIVPFFTSALLAAAHAPGFLWSEEGFGYDVLEYHLQVPKEYYLQGRIAYLPHNVYANFPSNVEMLYLLCMIVHGDVMDLGTTANLLHMGLGILFVYGVWVLGREWSPAAGAVGALTVGTTGWLGYLSGLAYVEHGLLFFGVTALAACVRASREAVAARQRVWFLAAGALAGLASGCKYTAVPMVAMPLAVGLMVIGGSLRGGARSLLLFGIGWAAALSPWLLKNTVMTGNPVFPLAGAVFEAHAPGWGLDEQQRWDRGHAVNELEVSARVGALWTHFAGDRYQRFGPGLLAIGLAGLAFRRRESVDALLFVVLLVQLAVWLAFTHLYARFLVPAIIPLSILAGRAPGRECGRARKALLAAGVAVGALWSLVFQVRLHYEEGLRGAPASLIYEGKLPGFEYVGFVNRELPPDAKLLMVGETRAFYMRPRLEYATVFNSSPFVEAAEGNERTPRIASWLLASGTTHVLVNWAEVDRLRRTYGFSEKISPRLFEELSGTVLVLVKRFPRPDGGEPYVDLYAVRRPASQPVPDRP